MNPEHERELRDLLRSFVFHKRFSYDPRERYALLKRWGAVQPTTFAEIGGAFGFARGYINGPHKEPACAFVIDTDPEYATAHLISHADSESSIDLKEEIKALYSGFTDGDRYAENLVEQRRTDRRLAMKHESEQQRGSYLLFAMVVGGILLCILLFK